MVYIFFGVFFLFYSLLFPPKGMLSQRLTRSRSVFHHFTIKTAASSDQYQTMERNTELNIVNSLRWKSYISYSQNKAMVRNIGFQILQTKKDSELLITLLMHTISEKNSPPGIWEATPNSFTIFRPRTPVT